MGTAGPFFQKRPPRHSPPISVERRQGRTLSPDATAPQRVYWCVVPIRIHNPRPGGRFVPGACCQPWGPFLRGSYGGASKGGCR